VTTFTTITRDDEAVQNVVGDEDVLDMEWVEHLARLEKVSIPPLYTQLCSV